MVNKELRNEARAHGDIQVLPFVDYYSLITWKTLAICIYGVEIDLLLTINLGFSIYFAFVCSTLIYLNRPMLCQPSI